MAKFRKKQVEIDAFRFDVDPPPQWFLEAKANGNVKLQVDAVVISTLEGEMKAGRGDWVIRGVKGELYPCKPDIFEQTYEES